MRRRFLFALAAAAVLIPSAQAAGPAFGVRAVGKWKLGYFVYDAKPGTTIEGKIAVSNNGDRGGVVKLFATDATTGQTSGTVYKTSGEKPKDVGIWLTLPAATMRLGPNERRVVPFTVHIPAGAAAGEHVGGIVAETAQQSTGTHSKGKTNVQITVRNLAIVAVQVNVPGPKVAKLAIGAVTAGGRKGYQQVFVHLTNTGNVMAKPSVTLSVADNEGASVLNERYQLDTILPHTAIEYPVNVSKQALGAGTYSTKVEISYDRPGGGRIVERATPGLEVTADQVGQVFTSAAPPTPPPGSAVGTVPAKSGSSLSPLLIVLIVGGGLLLLAGGWFAATARARRRPS
jgi:hypothetical protein